jgi:hypothetical protein
MPRIFDNIELDLLPALRETLEDFIINYDIKYRMGRDTEGGDG